MIDYRNAGKPVIRNEKSREKVRAVFMCLIILLAMGFAGWYENSVPTPQPSTEQMIKLADQNAAVYLVKR